MKKLFAIVQIYEEGNCQPLQEMRVDEACAWMEVDEEKIPSVTHQFEFQVITLELKRESENGL